MKLLAKSTYGDLKGHFYYSDKQKEVYKAIAQDGYDSLYENYALVDGKVVEYTEMRLLDDERELFFDDVKYLGVGTPHSVYEIIEVENCMLNRLKNVRTEADAENIKDELRELADYKSGIKEYIPQWPEIIGDN
jgi:hypothetical protein